MKKLLLIISSFLFCGIAFSQVITPVTPTVYGSHFNRVKADSALHVPEKNGLTTNSNDTTAQIFYNRVDSSFWGYSKIKGFFKVGSGGGSGYYGGIDTIYTEKGIRSDTVRHPGYSTLVADSIYIRDTSLNMGNGSVGQVLKKNSSVNGDWSWATIGGVDSTSLSIRGDTTFFNLYQGDVLGYSYYWQGDGSGGSGGTYPSDNLQTYTNGATVTVNNGVNILLVNPSTLQSAITVTLPAIPSTRNDIEIYFGGTIAAGSDVVTTITILSNTGQTLFEALVPTTMSSGEYLSYKFIPSLNRWYAKR